MSESLTIAAYTVGSMHTPGSFYQFALGPQSDKVGNVQPECAAVVLVPTVLNIHCKYPQFHKQELESADLAQPNTMEQSFPCAPLSIAVW